MYTSCGADSETWRRRPPGNNHLGGLAGDRSVPIWCHANVNLRLLTTPVWVGHRGLDGMINILTNLYKAFGLFHLALIGWDGDCNLPAGHLAGWESWGL